MNHAITVGGLLSVVALGLGTLMLGFGVLSVMAAGMSDAPSEGDGKRGCIAVGAGIVLVIGGILGLVL